MKITQEQYEKQQRHKQHQELLSVMKKVAEQLAQKPETSNFGEVAQAIDRNTDKINSFVKTISEVVSEPERDDTKLLEAIQNMQKALLVGLQEIKSCLGKETNPPVWEFEIKRNRFDYIEKVVGIPKK